MIRRRMKQCIAVALLTVTCCVVVIFENVNLEEEKYDHKVPKKTLLSVTEVPKKRHVTKSMRELGKMDEISKHFLFLNSVPKSGSEILIFLLEKIQGVNSFKHVRLKGGNRRRLTRVQEEETVDEIYKIRRNLAVPLSFDRNVYFINFTSFDKQLPTYINLIRHPVAKVMARAILKQTGTYDSYFMRCLLDSKRNCNFKTGRPYDLTIPYFCGHDPRCMLLNNDWAFEMAKSNVEKYYKVVGVLEELNTTLDALEREIPQFFAGARVAYHTNLLDIYKHKKEPEVPRDVQITLENTLVKEVEFYQWVKRRLTEGSIEDKGS